MTTKTPRAATKRSSTTSSKKSDPVAGKNELAKNEDNKALAVGGGAAVPDFMKKDAGKGTQGISNTEVETPRIKLMQAISPEIEGRDDLKVGEFYHTIGDMSLGKDVRVVILMVDQRYILWQPRWDGGGILARSDDGVHWSPKDKGFEVKPIKGVNKKVTWTTKHTVQESGLAEWGSSNPEDPDSPPAATKMFNCLVAFPDHPELGFAVVTLQRAGVKVARKLLGKLKITQAPSFGIVFNMFSEQVEGPEGPFQNYAFRMAGFVETQDEYDFYNSAFERFSRSGINIKDLEDAQDEGGSEAGGGDAPKGAQGY